MKESAALHLERLVERYPALSEIKPSVDDAAQCLARAFYDGGKLLVCGNGGSAADAEHIVGELMKGFHKKRGVDNAALGEYAARLQGALPAIALTGHTSLATAFANDVDPLMVFAQQVFGYGRAGDVFLGISTSGGAKNVCAAAEVAHRLKLKTIALTGADGGKLASICDYSIRVPARETADIQELHLPVYHCLCAMLEEEFF